MTRDDIARMAKEAGFADGMAEIMGLEGFYNFAALVAAEKDKEIKRLQDLLYTQLGELTALRAEKQIRKRVEELKEQPR